MAVTESISDRTNRAQVYNNYAVNATSFVSYVVFIGPGNVLLNGTGPISWPGGNQGPFPASSTTQVYVSPDFGQITSRQLTDTTVSFPANSLPLCFAITDGVGRIQTIIDTRPTDPL